MHRVVLGHHATGVVVVEFLSLLLGEVTERVACAGDGLDRGIDVYGAWSSVLEREAGGRPVNVKVPADPFEIALTVLTCPVWYVAVFGCHIVGIPGKGLNHPYPGIHRHRVE